MRYKLNNNLTISQNAYKAAVFNGARILARAIRDGKFDDMSSDQKTDYARSLVKTQIESVLATLEGDCKDKANIIECLELHMISNMIN